MSILATEQTQIVTHQNILSVGESVRQRYVETAEEERERATRCREEVVRREEQQLREEALEKAREGWEKERQELFREAHQSHVRAIARHSDALEKELRKEFSATLEAVQRKHDKDVLETVQRVWGEADSVRERAVADSRLEEQAAAREEADREAELVAGEKRMLVQRLEEEKQRALREQKDALNDAHREGLQVHKRELRVEFDQELEFVSSDYEAKLGELQTRYDEELSTSGTLRQELADTTAEMIDWQQKYEKLKLEFSNFIDQFPGFRGDFILK